MQMTFGKLLRKLRKEARKTQEDIANRVNISQPQLSEWERDKSVPTPKHKDVIDSIIGVLGLPIEVADQLRALAGLQTSGSVDLGRESIQQLQQLLHSHVLSDDLRQRLESDVLFLAAGYSALAAEGSRNRQLSSTEVQTEVSAARGKIETALKILTAQLALIEANASLHQYNVDVARQLLNSNAVTDSLKYVGGNRIEARVELLIGDTELIAGNWGDAYRHYERARLMFRSQGDVIDSARARRKMGTIHILQSEYRAADAALRAAQDSFLRAGNDYEYARTLFDLAWLYSADKTQSRNLSLAEESIIEAQGIARELDNEYLQMLVFSGMGHLLRYQNSSYADEKYESALQLAMRRDDKREQGWILLGLGRSAHMRAQKFLEDGDTSEAMRSYEAAISRFEEAEYILNTTGYRYRLNLALLLKGQLILQIRKHISDNNFPSIHAELDRMTNKEDSHYGNVLRLVQSLYTRALSGFVAMGSRNYEAKTRQHFCELFRIEMEDIMGDYPYILPSLNESNGPSSDKDRERSIRVQRLQEDVDEQMYRLALLHEDFHFPEHMARATAEHAEMMFRLGRWDRVILLFGSAILYANSANVYIMDALETRMDRLIGKVRGIDLGKADQAQLKQLCPLGITSLLVMSAFYEKLAAHLEQYRNDSPLNREPARREQLDRFMAVLGDKAKAARRQEPIPKAFQDEIRKLKRGSGLIRSKVEPNKKV